jgi:hypothetical protein
MAALNLFLTRIFIIIPSHCNCTGGAKDDPALLRVAHAPAEIIQALVTFRHAHDIEAVPRQEQTLPLL